MIELSAGARALAVYVKRHGVRGVATKLNASASAVQTWAKGNRTPSGAARAALQSAFGIGPETWEPVTIDDQTSSAVPRANRQTGEQRDQRAVTRPATPPAGGAHQSTEVTDHEDPRANAVATLHKLRVLLDEVPPERAHNVANAITASSRLLAKLTGQIDVSETMLLRSMGWARIKTSLVEAVRPYPEAARALAEAIEKLSATA